MRNRFLLFSFFVSSLFNSVTAQWSNLQGGANDPVRAFYSDSTNLMYVTGRFTQIGGNNINQVAVWDGNNWNSFGNNNLFSSPHDVMCIAKFNNQIVVGGLFDSIGNSQVNNIARWNGLSWENMGMGFNDYVSALYQYNGELYAGGAFDRSGIDTVRTLAKWNGHSWDTVGNFIGQVNSLTEYNNKLIIAGSYHQQLNPGSNIIGYDGVSWDTSISKLNNTVIKVRNINDTLYACGTFTAGPVNPSNYLSAFYNNSWHAMPIPSGGANTITDIIEYHNKKYVCGYFTTPPDIGVLNGIGYDSLFNASGFIKSMHIFNGKLFIAGQFFQTFSGQNYNCIVSYDDLLNSADNFSIKINDNINIYPNPSINGKINIDLLINENMVFEFLKPNGQLIYKTYSKNSFEVILQKGVYFIKISDSEKNIITKKIIVL